MEKAQQHSKRSLPPPRHQQVCGQAEELHAFQQGIRASACLHNQPATTHQAFSPGLQKWRVLQ
jgi:hypothetical protein